MDLVARWAWYEDLEILCCHLECLLVWLVSLLKHLFVTLGSHLASTGARESFPPRHGLEENACRHLARKSPALSIWSCAG